MIATTALLGPVTAVLAALGLAIGSFRNVVAYRVPAGLSVIAPASACPNCESAIRSRDNVPILSWLLLGRRCRDCRTPISARYPLVEALTAVSFVAVTVRFWPIQEAPAATASRLLVLVALLYLAAISVALAAIDIDTHTLPNAIVLPSYLVGAVLLGAAALVAGDLGALLRMAVGAVALYVFYAVAALVRPGGMGFGDVKLAGSVGLFLGFAGWGQLLVGAFAAFFLGGLFAVALLALRRIPRSGGIPFGPWILIGTWVGLFVGEPLWHAYLTLIGAV